MSDLIYSILEKELFEVIKTTKQMIFYNKNFFISEIVKVIKI